MLGSVVLSWAPVLAAPPRRNEDPLAGVMCVGLECMDPDRTAPDWSRTSVAVINLDERQDRLDNFAKVVEEHKNLGFRGGKICRLPAVKADDVRGQEAPAHTDYRYSRHR